MATRNWLSECCWNFIKILFLSSLETAQYTLPSLGSQQKPHDLSVCSEALVQTAAWHRQEVRVELPCKEPGRGSSRQKC